MLFIFFSDSLEYLDPIVFCYLRVRLPFQQYFLISGAPTLRWGFFGCFFTNTKLEAGAASRKEYTNRLLGKNAGDGFKQGCTTQSPWAAHGPPGQFHWLTPILY